MFARNRGLLPVIIRPSNTYGERQGRNGVEGVVSALMQRSLTGDPFEVWGDGSVVRDYLHVSDLVRICLKAVESNVTGTFNAGSGVGTSLRVLVDLVRTVSGRAFADRYGAARPVDAAVNVLDISAARQAFGWVPEVMLAEGLRRTWDWTLRNAPSK